MSICNAEDEFLFKGIINPDIHSSRIANPPELGYIDYDLNKGCGSSSDYIYLFYKAETNAAGDNLDYITDFYISDNSSASTLTADKTTLTPDGQDLTIITVELTDAHGTLNPTARNELKVTVSGPASIAAFGNADIKDTAPYADTSHKAWQGRAMLVVRSTGEKGTVSVRVQGKDLRTGRIKLKAK